jgi:broad specificity polyphosphatase/5'/3'-nucleotidase SurE
MENVDGQLSSWSAAAEAYTTGRRRIATSDEVKEFDQNFILDVAVAISIVGNAYLGTNLLYYVE